MTTDTPSPLETIRQRWAAHVQPRSIVVVDDLCVGVYGVRDLRPEEASLLRAPEDVAWLFVEVEHARSERDGYRAAFDGMVDVLQARLTVSPFIPIPLQNALAVLASRWEAHGAENFTSEDFEWTGADGVARGFRVVVQRIDGESPAAMVEEVTRLRAALAAEGYEAMGPGPGRLTSRALRGSPTCPICHHPWEECPGCGNP